MPSHERSEKINKMAYWLLKDVNKAIYEYDMICEADRVAVAVSGGKDSLALLKLLHERQPSAREKYSLAAIHISGNGTGPISPPNPVLIRWLEGTGIPFITRPFSITTSDTIPLNCHRCAWNRRRQLFELARELDCNVLALGHHADDLAQTTLMSLLFHAKAETMSPVGEYFDGIFRVIRPMCYLPENRVARFAQVCSFPPDGTSCPQANKSQRQNAKEFLDQLQRQNPNIRLNLLRAGLKGIQNKDE